MAQAQRTFRVFISSTFSDLIAERNAMQERVFPRLRELAEANGCRFQAIDLRWGVSEEAALDQQTMKICLGEIARCQKVSPRPNFLILLGNRYGWRPLPCEIPVEEVERLFPYIPAEDRALVNEWYWRDDNAVPTVFVLQPRTGQYVNHEIWYPLESRLHVLLERAAALANLPEADLVKYQASATEQEILQGALQVVDARAHIYCYAREMEGIPQGDHAGDFIDRKQGQPDLQAAAQLVDLKSRLNAVLGVNYHAYSARWEGSGPSLNHIDQFCEDLYACLSQVILKEIEHPSGIMPGQKSPDYLRREEILDEEGLAHQMFAEERLRFFVGRTELLERIISHVKSVNRHCLVIHGAGGTGKSALMAKAVQRAQEIFPEAEIVYRFIGATPGSSDGRSLLTSLCAEISRRYGVDPTSLPVDYQELVPELGKRMALAGVEHPLILFLDSLDQLSPDQNARSLTWLPGEFPAHVFVITSTRPDGILQILSSRQAQLEELGGLTSRDGDELLFQWLRSVDRTLQPVQRQEVLEKFTCSLGNPLYLKLAFEESRLWASYQAPSQLAESLHGIIESNLILRLQKEGSHGRMLISHALAYLAASRHGLAEDELVDLLSRDPEVYAWFIQNSYHLPADLVQSAMQLERGRSVSKEASGLQAEQAARLWLQTLREDLSRLYRFLAEVLPKAGGPRLPIILWSRLSFDLASYLAERVVNGSSLLGFYHRELGEVASTMFLPKEEQPHYHEKLADYFSSKADPAGDHTWSGHSAHALSEWPAHVVLAGRRAELQTALADFNFLQSKVTACGPQSLLDDYELVREKGAMPDALSSLHNAIRLSARVLEQNPSLLAAQLIARLLEDTQPEVQQVLSKASPRGEEPWLRPLTASLAPPSGPLERTLSGQTGEITALAISSDRIISAAQDKTIRLWDRKNGQVVAILETQAIIPALAAAPEIDKFFSGSREGEIRRWQLQAGSQAGIHAPAGGESVSRLLVRPDGSRLVSIHNKFIHERIRTRDGSRDFSGSMDCTLRVWDLLSGKQLIQITGNYDKWAVTPDLTMAVSAYSAVFNDDLGILRMLEVWDLTTGRSIRRLKGAKGKVDFLELAPDAMLIAGFSNPGSAGTTLLCWELRHGRELAQLQHDRSISRLCATQDPRRLVFMDGSLFQKPRLFQWELGKRPSQLETGEIPLSSFDALIPHPCQPWVVTTGNVITLWDLISGKATFQVTNPGDHFNIAPDGTHAVSGKVDGVIYLWNLEQALAQKEAGSHTGPVTSVAVLPDGKWAFTGSQDGTVRISSATGGGCFWKPEAGQSAILDLMISRGEESLVGRAGGSILVLEIPHGHVVHKIEAARGTLTFLRVTPAGHRAVSGAGGIENHPQAWDLYSGDQIGTIHDLVPNHTSQYGQDVIAAAITPNGRYFLAGVDDNVIVWDIEKQEELTRLVETVHTPGGSFIRQGAFSGQVTAIATSPDGSLFAASDMDKVVLGNIFKPSGIGYQGSPSRGVIETRNQRFLFTFTGIEGLLHTLQFIDHGRRLLCVSRHQLRLYAVGDGSQICAIDQEGAFAGACSPSTDGRRLAAISAEGELGLWDTARRKKVATFLGDTRILSGSLSNDGTFLAAGDADGNIHLLAVEQSVK